MKKNRDDNNFFINKHIYTKRFTNMLRRVSQKLKQDINMTQIAYGKSIIDYSDITLFDECKTRNQNDESNKKRENIIGYILNNGFQTNIMTKYMCMEQNGKK